ncbi:hypothetical protein EUA06_11630 [Nocardioides glacieisoli]|uniref:Uncharacterized protein n=1 Tax=Nocardioides glacieisoli TaxID=1168730 RepID=A0A4Q2RNP4_9ACTN|nr:hypothetical protein [Nocardioides glacieisoli]RYB90056.1 hypothetical protein EUA06_11630 [Nocardioides glacieisoli]
MTTSSTKANIRDLLQRQMTWHCRPGSYSQSDIDAIISAWRKHRRPVSRRLVSTTGRFLAWGYSPAETAQWLSLGYDAQQAEYYGRSLFASVQQAAWARPYISVPGQTRTAKPSHGCCSAEVPWGLLRLIFAAGCPSAADLNELLFRWHAGEHIEPELRMLAALRGVSMPECDAPPLYPHA